MDSKNRLFSMIEPRKELKGLILNSIKREEMKKAIYKVAFGLFTSLISVSATVFFIFKVINDAYQSGLSEYLSLLISDGALVASYWMTYTMSIIESLPILQITFVFASIWVFAWSVNMILVNFKYNRSIIYKVS